MPRKRATPVFVDYGVSDLGDHLDYLFGFPDRRGRTATRGYVAVATADRSKRDSQGKVRPIERKFMWPKDRDDMFSYIARAQRKPWTEVWICPYPMRTNERKLGNSTARRIIHADVDKPLLNGLRSSLVAQGFRLVSTGTPGHVQVYARLDRSLTPGEHRAACAALRTKVKGDSKIADNDYLKLPGGWNYKNHPTEPTHRRNAEAYPVELLVPGRQINANHLMTWLGAREESDRIAEVKPEWKRIHIQQRRIPAWVSALEDEKSEGEGSGRYMRCYGVIRSVADLGFNDDEVHTLLDGYDPGQDKFGGRSGGWHGQISHVLANYRLELSAGTDIERFDFWSRRPVLQHIHTAALAGYASPWATLVITLIRVLHVIPPRVQMPRLGGSMGSLNLFSALVGKSGGGKGTALYAGANAVDVGTIIRAVNLGSGEGISKVFRFRDKGGGIGIRTNQAMFDAGEITTMIALMTRQGSTIGGELLKAFPGEALGFQNADENKTIPVDADSYRMGLVVSAQPGKCGKLFDEAVSGLPQRFLFMPADNPDHPDDAPDMPHPWVWTPPDVGADDVVLGVCDAARGELLVRNRDRVRGVLREDELDAHWPAIKLKVACAFALLDGRVTVSDEDWDLATAVMAVSRRTRDTIVHELRTVRTRATVASGEMEGHKRVAAERVVEQAAVDRAAARVLTVLRKHGGWMPGSELKSAMGPRNRDHFIAGLTHVLREKTVERKTSEYRGQSARFYRSVDGG